MEIDTLSTIARPPADRGAASNTLSGADFMQLLVTQLTNQDPLEPTSNEDILRQLSSIRDIELSMTLVDSLTALTGNQRYASAAGLIGKHVSGHAVDESDTLQAVSGTVVGVRFGADGTVHLELDSGVQLPLNSVETVASPLRAAESLIGQIVRGLSRTDGRETELVEGLVTAVRNGDAGDVMLELDTGEELRLRDLVDDA